MWIPRNSNFCILNKTCLKIMKWLWVKCPSKFPIENFVDRTHHTRTLFWYITAHFLRVGIVILLVLQSVHYIPNELHASNLVTLFTTCWSVLVLVACNHFTRSIVITVTKSFAINTVLVAISHGSVISDELVQLK